MKKSENNHRNKCYLLIFHIISDDFEHFINIPCYIVRGAGKHTHFEYEIRITLPEETEWYIMRRYSRFRELHISMKSLYGEKVLFLLK